MGAAARLEAPQILDLPLFADAARFSAFPPQNLASMAVNAFQIPGCKSSWLASPAWDKQLKCAGSTSDRGNE